MLLVIFNIKLYSTVLVHFGTWLLSPPNTLYYLSVNVWILQMSGQGVGVVGVVEVDFLEPIHNKQDFNKTDRYK